jgi:hypothetical protein
MPFATGNRRTRIMVASVACLLLLGWTDYATGYEFGFFIFYFIPVTTALTPSKIRQTVHDGQRTRKERDRVLEENRELKRRMQEGADPP